MPTIELSLLEMLSIALYILTAVLLGAAMSRQMLKSAPFAALLSIVSVTGANACLIWSYTGEPPVELARHLASPAHRSKWNGFEVSGPGAPAAGHFAHTDVVGGDDANPFRDCSDCPELVLIPPGYVQIGAEPNDQLAGPEEKPGRNVGFANPFAIGRFEVTIAEFSTFLKSTGRTMPACSRSSSPPAERHDRHPITCVSWREAEAYVTWLSVRTGRIYRLPSEAEWEYAARANRNTERPAARGVRAEASAITPGRGGSNKFGVYDMMSSPAEFAADCWVPNLARLSSDGRATIDTGGCNIRTLRGALPREPASAHRLSARRPHAQDERERGIGFRVARDVR